MSDICPVTVKKLDFQVSMGHMGTQKNWKNEPKKERPLKSGFLGT